MYIFSVFCLEVYSLYTTFAKVNDIRLSQRYI